MLSMKAKYAIRALMVMAKQENKMLSSKAIAADADVPQKFLDTILQEMRREGLVDSKRGIFGGYFLLKSATQIKVGDVIRIMDGPLAPIRCASVTAYQKCEDCVDEASCAIRKVMIDVRNSIAGVLDKKSIKDMLASGAPDQTGAFI